MVVFDEGEEAVRLDPRTADECAWLSCGSTETAIVVTGDGLEILSAASVGDD
jgi:hypothetical protein